MFGKKDKASEPSVESIMKELEAVKDPELGADVVALKMVKDVRLEAGKVRIVIELPTPAWEPKELLAQEIQAVLRGATGDRTIEITWGSDVRPSRPTGMTGQNLVPGARNVVLFASGKGGVGKSTVATNVAAALARLGARVGLLDADIYGPSIPTMLGTRDRPEVSGQRLVPIERHGMKLMSIGFIVDPREAMAWRGPMLNGALIQFMRDVDWGDLDYLILDLPPGTGDVQLTVAQNVKVSGAVLVSTPQDVALADVTRGKAMFDKVDIPILGVVENMAFFECPQCHSIHHIFASGGASRLAKELDLPLLGRVPLETSTRISADDGCPEVLTHPESGASTAFVAIARRVATMLAAQAASASQSSPKTLRIIQ